MPDSYKGPAPRHVAVAGGGTAGHVLAGLAIAAQYRADLEAKTFFIGCASGFESWLAPARGEELLLIRGFPYARQSMLGKLRALWNVIPGFIDARRILQLRRPDLLVAVGGYPAMSAAIAARSLGIPVVMHEANARPGLANRWVSRFAQGICFGFEETRYLGRGHLTAFTGSPPGVDLRGVVRRPPDAQPQTVLITGGSEGSPFLNRALPGLIAALGRPQLRVWHLTGKDHAEEVRAAYASSGLEARVDAFVNNIEDAYKEATFVIACPGALTLAEIAQVGLPSLLVPLSTAANNHQEANARSFCEQTGGKWVAEEDWDVATQSGAIGKMLDDPKRLDEVGRQARSWSRPDAAAHVVKLCEQVLASPERVAEQIPRSRVVWNVMLAAVAAFLLRTVLPFRNVITAAGIQFQETDAWFHVRTAANLAAHFPWRSGFDPYAVFPGGGNIPTGPVWDYLLAGVSFLVARGVPSPHTIELVAAWLPAVLGSLFPVAVFWLARRLFGAFAALFAAWWSALVPGTLLWVGHLGLADHHILETLLAFLALGFACCAVDEAALRITRRAAGYTLASGIALGLYYGTRPAGIFLVAIFAAAAFLQPSMAPVVAAILAIAAVLFIPVSGALWSAQTWLALLAGIVLTASIAGLFAIGSKRQWPAVRLRILLIGFTALIVVGVWAVQPAMFDILRLQVTRALTAKGPIDVGELKPLLRAHPESPVQILFGEFGFAWILAFPALAGVILVAWLTRRASLTLFAVWSAVMLVGAFAQARMSAYFTADAALLAGLACVWIVRLAEGSTARTLLTNFLMLLVAGNLTVSLWQMEYDRSPSPEWRDALMWMRANTPDPLAFATPGATPGSSATPASSATPGSSARPGSSATSASSATSPGDAPAWTARYPALAANATFPYPPSAYGVAVWWEFGYWVEYLAHRIPSSNGTQAGVQDTAAFYVETDPQAALRILDRNHWRYVLADPSLGWDLKGHVLMSSILDWTHRQPSDYYRGYYYKGRGVMLYLPNFYRTMATRLNLANGQSLAAGDVWVVHSRLAKLRNGMVVNEMDWSRKFDSEKQARDFLGNEKRPEYALGSLHATLSCVDLEAVPGLRLVHASPVPEPAEDEPPAQPVKVFERVVP